MCNTCDGHVDTQKHAHTHTCTASALRTAFTSATSCHFISCCLYRLRCQFQLNYSCGRFSMNSCGVSASQHEQNEVAYMCFCVCMLFHLNSTAKKLRCKTSCSIPDKGTQRNTSSSKLFSNLSASFCAPKTMFSGSEMGQFCRSTNKQIHFPLTFTCCLLIK